MSGHSNREVVLPGLQYQVLDLHYLVPFLPLQRLEGMFFFYLQEYFLTFKTFKKSTFLTFKKSTF